MGNIPLDGETDLESEIGEIDEANEMDAAEPIRQFAILALPMRPHCGENCPGIGLEVETESEIDHRMAALAALLDDSAETEEA
jgi:uncharacterized metal-binding protein YceD (DUF177 family)